MMLDFAGVGSFALKPERTIVRNWTAKTEGCDARGARINRQGMRLLNATRCRKKPGYVFLMDGQKIER